MNEHTISKLQAKQLKPYLKYMDFGNVRPERQFIVEKMMYQNMVLGNIKTSIIDDLRSNYIKVHPESEVPEVLRRV